MEDKTRLILAEQHRNTKHDVIDIIQDVREEYIEKGYIFPEAMFDRMIGGVMNLKQRVPSTCNRS
jgi:hypothetical protein